MQNKLNNCEIITKKVSRISIIGYGITNDTNILKNIILILEEVKDQIHKIDINNGKIRITFKGTIDNGILEKLHNELIKNPD